ncbi:MAG: Gfo/Idh/MocA family oxidoreductase [Terriglobia bacterium]|jgi:predicted dehydrogenase
MGRQSSSLGRREFLAAAATSSVGLGLPAAGQEAAPKPKGNSGRRRVVLVGTGGRGSTNWGRNLVHNYSDVLEFVGLCDINRKRMAVARDFIGVSCPMFMDTEFDEMIKKTSPDLVIVTTVDCFHPKYICRAMELGVDVISEKPMSTDEKMVQEVLDTERRTGRKLIIAENYRFSPDGATIKKILDSEEIGTITSVDYNVYLNTSHGTSYFRRWHGFKQFNGSILDSEGSHFLDLVQWWLGAEPAEVQAFGSLRRYGYNGEYRSVRCMNCPHQDKCEFFWDVTKNKFDMDFYVNAESEDDYIIDGCVYRRNINVWDTMTLNVRYHTGVLMSFSLNAFMPYEGYRIAFNGTKGRLDARAYHAQPWKVEEPLEIRVTPLFKESRTMGAERQNSTGGHWGSDSKLQDSIFRGPIPDPLHQRSTNREAAFACLLTIAARRSIEHQRPVFIEELVKL